jgi:hypothetical protein
MNICRHHDLGSYQAAPADSRSYRIGDASALVSGRPVFTDRDWRFLFGQPWEKVLTLKVCWPLLLSRRVFSHRR